MTIEASAFDPPLRDEGRPHKVSVENDLSLFLRSNPDATAVRGLARLLSLQQAHPEESLPPEIVEAMQKVQTDNAKKSEKLPPDQKIPNTFEQLRAQLDKDYPEIPPSVSDDGVSGLPPVA